MHFASRLNLTQTSCRDIPDKPGKVSGTRSVAEPVDRGISRSEFDALVAEVNALKAQIALLKIGNGNAERSTVTKSRGNGNVASSALTPAEKQRRYRERLKNKN